MPAAAVAGDSTIHSPATVKPPPDTNSPSLSLQTPVPSEVTDSISNSLNCLRRSSRGTRKAFMGETESGFDLIEAESERKSLGRGSGVRERSDSLSCKRSSELSTLHETEIGFCKRGLREQCTSKEFMGEFDLIEAESERKSLKRGSGVRERSDSLSCKPSRLSTLHETEVGFCERGLSDQCASKEFMGEIEGESERKSLKRGNDVRKRSDSLSCEPSRLLSELSALHEVEIDLCEGGLSEKCTSKVFTGEIESGLEAIETESERKLLNRGNDVSERSDSLSCKPSHETEIELCERVLSEKGNCLRKSSRNTTKVFMGETESGFEAIEAESERKSMKRGNDIRERSDSFSCKPSELSTSQGTEVGFSKRVLSEKCTTGEIEGNAERVLSERKLLKRGNDVREKSDSLSCNPSKLLSELSALHETEIDLCERVWSEKGNCLRKCTEKVVMGEIKSGFEAIAAESERKSSKRGNDSRERSDSLSCNPSRLLSELSKLHETEIELCERVLSEKRNCLRRSSRCTTKLFRGETESELEAIKAESERKSMKRGRYKGKDVRERSGSLSCKSPRFSSGLSALRETKNGFSKRVLREKGSSSEVGFGPLGFESTLVEVPIISDNGNPFVEKRSGFGKAKNVKLKPCLMGFSGDDDEEANGSKLFNVHVELESNLIDVPIILGNGNLWEQKKSDYFGSGSDLVDVPIILGHENPRNFEKIRENGSEFGNVHIGSGLVDVPIVLGHENPRNFEKIRENGSEFGNVHIGSGLVDVPIVLGHENPRNFEKIRENGSKFGSGHIDSELVDVPIVLGHGNFRDEKINVEEMRENGTDLGIGRISSGLVEVPIILGDKKFSKEIGSKFGLKKNKSDVGIGFESSLTEVTIISGDGKPCEEIRNDFKEVDEVMMELSAGNGNIEETEIESFKEVYCGESKSGIESFAFSPGGTPRDNEETRACFEKETSESEGLCSFVGEPVSEEEAQRRWGWRYELKNQKMKRQGSKLNAGDEDEIILNVKCHYTQARVNSSSIINLGDCALIKGDGREDHVGKILEFFKTTDGDDYFRVQWFYRAEDTVLQNQAVSHDKKRIFYSTVMNDNMLDCIVSKVRVTEVSPMLRSQPRFTSFDFYYDMEYCVEYSTFRRLSGDDSPKSCDILAPTDVREALKTISTPLEKVPSRKPYKAELALLDLYSGCGGMSTGLCLGAKLSSVNLVTRWAVDADQAACDSLKLNHPETLVRKLNAEDFLELLKEWQKLCQRYVVNNLDKAFRSREEDVENVTDDVNRPHGVNISAGEYEVQRLVDICYGDPCKTGKPGIHFKVRWLGYSSGDDTWEPSEGLSNCQERIEDFVRSGYKSRILPLTGDVDVLCGGPPCQGISGYNRHRNVVSPLSDEKNRQIIVFMDVVEFLRPKYALMENVNDILKFDKASLGRYALSRLIHMKYQARLGSMASGCYGLPQFRLRVFLWGALPREKLPQFPLPSHDVVVRYWPASEFERNTVAYDEGKHRDLEDAVFLRDAISDLQAVTSQETRDQMSYELPPETEFQKFIRLTKDEMTGSRERSEDAQNDILYDHRPLPLSEDEQLRVCQIPHKKGANFRDIPGVIVGPDNVAYWDPKNETKLPSGKPWVPKNSFHFEHGKSKRPYGRVWWDETVATIVTFPNIHSMATLHPDQDRVFTIRECARLQGFPDYYRFTGSVIDRYRQVGNAVSVPVARALGYCLGMAIRKLGGKEPLMSLPPKFAFQRTPTEEILVSHK